MKVSQNTAGVRYAIRDIVLAARKVEENGVKVDYLNVGDPLQYGFQTPENVIEAFIKAAKSGYNYYAPSEGLPDLRQEISIKERHKGLDTDADRILITNGISEALDMTAAAILDKGDQVLLPGPYYPPYAAYVKIHGGIPVEFAVDTFTGKPDIADLRSKITSRTVAICIISPSNPTGMTFSQKSLQDIVDVANEYGLYVICDEIYDRIVYENRFSGIGSVAEDSPVIVLNGFSKVHLMTGWRLGYIAFGGSPDLEPLQQALQQLARIRIATSMPAQYAAIESLRGPQGYVDKLVSDLWQRRDIVVKRLNAMPNISCPKVQGAFYVFPQILDNPYPDDHQFILELLKSQGVLGVHGSGFGKYGKDHFRLVFLPPPDTLEPALDKIETFVTNPPV